ncbi:hypothetical protein [Herbaspirillum lusitanum]|uniref:hypothetical protein n=1 Tax=Herbaspirillum lusitanum TaxID=213312 RepID=UPI0002D9F956|nr:hypothetical protein [Herbaspirillum lusitanum]
MKKQLALLFMVGAMTAGIQAHAVNAGGGDGDDKTGPANNATNQVTDNAKGKSHAARSAERKEKRASEAGAMGKASGGDGDDKSIPANNPDMKGNPGAKR